MPSAIATRSAVVRFCSQRNFRKRKKERLVVSAKAHDDCGIGSRVTAGGAFNVDSRGKSIRCLALIKRKELKADRAIVRAPVLRTGSAGRVRVEPAVRARELFLHGPRFAIPQSRCLGINRFDRRLMQTGQTARSTSRSWGFGGGTSTTTSSRVGASGNLGDAECVVNVGVEVDESTASRRPKT